MISTMLVQLGFTYAMDFFFFTDSSQLSDKFGSIHDQCIPFSEKEI